MRQSLTALVAVLAVLATVDARAELAKAGPMSFDVHLGAEAFMRADLDADDGEDAIRFGVERASLVGIAKAWDFAKLKVHLLAMQDKNGDLGVDLADAVLMLNFLPEVNLKAGRFKKPLTRTFSTPWRTWGFFELPTAFKKLKGGFGLGGRGEGVALYGKIGGVLTYTAGVFNGAEEAKGDVTDESVQAALRLEAQVLPFLGVGAGFTYMPSVTKGGVEMDLMGFAANILVQYAGLEVDAEFIGHMTSPEEGDGTTGGGFYANALYRIPLPQGELQPGFRFGQYYGDFDDTDSSTTEITGVLNWWLRTNVRAGVEYQWARTKTAADETDASMVLAKLTLFH